MLLDTVYNSSVGYKSTADSSLPSKNDKSNSHKTKLQSVLDGYNYAYGDDVTIIASNEDYSEVEFTKPKDKFKLITKIEARLSGKKKFVENGDSLIMTRTWN